MNIQHPQDQVYWYLDKPVTQQLQESIITDVVIVGGGMAGLSAAQSFAAKGLSVVLLEQYYCGSGASGKSSGFITQDSELGLRYFLEKDGSEKAKKLWDFVTRGVTLIQKNITDYAIDCDYLLEDALVAALGKADFLQIQKEHEARVQLGYPSKLYSHEELSHIIGSQHYYGGVSYGGTFGINAYAYCQAMKKVLQDMGVKIFEETPVTAVQNSGVETLLGARVKAKQIVICTDRFLPQLGLLKYEIYHAQTFLLLSAPLSDSAVKALFPQKKMMVWDTELIYNYYRLTGDNRLMLGGGSVWSTYDKEEKFHAHRMFKKLNSYFKKQFPNVPVNFEYMWPGLIGISKDIMPIAGPDNKNSNIYYIGAATGLPWAAALGHYSAEHSVDGKRDFDHYFSPYRTFAFGSTIQHVLGTQLTFALSNFTSLYL